MNCKSCKYFEINEDVPKGYGHCGRWHEGYYVAMEEVKPNEVLVEDDEGWGNVVGPDFGCVLFEAKEDENLVHSGPCKESSHIPTQLRALAADEHASTYAYGKDLRKAADYIEKLHRIIGELVVQDGVAWPPVENR